MHQVDVYAGQRRLVGGECCWCSTIAACAFAALLLAIVQSGGIESLVTKVIKVALSVSL
ncbi:DUF4244 domain-containing protein [Ornithinimicrobium cavernae]|uniref:DUF4244 domain-containing protein n=1 Tax=Ornithinimicrobium cavernae TaxID=2666047 RepID=UPI000D6919A7|nr:DUF4244 domain-containing protein [Ornithinimicrobium cavernae]